jgi:hypothetical protein
MEYNLQKISVFTDSIAPLVRPVDLQRIRAHLHGLLCQFSTTLDEYGIGFVQNLELSPQPRLKFKLQDMKGETQNYELAFDDEYRSAEILMEGQPFVSQRLD